MFRRRLRAAEMRGKQSCSIQGNDGQSHVIPWYQRESATGGGVDRDRDVQDMAPVSRDE